jgi:hypothetical protein
MLLFGIVWVLLILNYLTEVRRLPVMGERVEEPRSPRVQVQRAASASLEMRCR